jgi:hypothetical protein
LRQREREKVRERRGDGDRGGGVRRGGGGGVRESKYREILNKVDPKGKKNG